MSEEKSSYKQIMKATSLFGGVQVFTVLISLVRAKFVAIYLGPIGMGISSLLVTTVTIIISIASLGTNFSVIRDVSLANESGDLKKLSTTIAVFRQWLKISCFFGVVLLIGLSPWLSQLTFGNKDYTWSFVFLSLFLIFTILTSGNTALLQGTRQLRFTAKSSVFGAFLGLLTAVPLYYFFGTKGIVPALLVGAVSTYIISLVYAQKIYLEPVNISRKESVKRGSQMVKLGIVMVAAQILGYVITYIINTFIRSKGGLGDVGLYQAGTSLTNQSMGLVFSAMFVDYFPRLSAVCSDKLKVNELVNRQGIITVLLSFPILIILIIFAPLFIHILLSPKFYVITSFIRWLAFGTIFTVPMVVMGYIPLAKGDKKNYFLYGSLYNNLLSLIFYIGGYWINGLIGMAIGYALFQITYCIFILIVLNKIYDFFFSKEFVSIFIVFLMFSVLAFSSTLISSVVLRNIIVGIVLLFTGYFSYIKLDKYLELGSQIKQKFNLKRNNNL